MDKCECSDDNCRAYSLSKSGHPGASGSPGNVELDDESREYHKQRDKLVNELYWLDFEHYARICKRK